MKVASHSTNLGLKGAVLSPVRPVEAGTPSDLHALSFLSGRVDVILMADGLLFLQEEKIT